MTRQIIIMRTRDQNRASGHVQIDPKYWRHFLVLSEWILQLRVENVG